MILHEHIIKKSRFFNYRVHKHYHDSDYIINAKSRQDKFIENIIFLKNYEFSYLVLREFGMRDRKVKIF